ncbi:L-lysine 2-3-aminomutase, partial [Penicillium psychrosexuale]|uniref:L-lysine 2-3-aminomutase n=1 Tax=Penicillium psychrosexuale TaxID=1002107 RepID=UPI002544DBFA
RTHPCHPRSRDAKVALTIISPSTYMLLASSTPEISHPTLTLPISDTYDHRVWKTGLPVRSAVLKPHAGELVVGWVTTSESSLLVWKIGLPVRSAVLKPHAGELVVGWVTTSESSLFIAMAYSSQALKRGCFER